MTNRGESLSKKCIISNLCHEWPASLSVNGEHLSLIYEAQISIVFICRYIALMNHDISSRGQFQSKNVSCNKYITGLYHLPHKRLTLLGFQWGMFHFGSCSTEHRFLQFI